jgi:hypothetical protein
MPLTHEALNLNKDKNCKLRDVNGFTLRQTEVLRKSTKDAEKSKELFKTGATLIKSALRD